MTSWAQATVGPTKEVLPTHNEVAGGAVAVMHAWCPVRARTLAGLWPSLPRTSSRSPSSSCFLPCRDELVVRRPFRRSPHGASKMRTDAPVLHVLLTPRIVFSTPSATAPGRSARRKPEIDSARLRKNEYPCVAAAFVKIGRATIQHLPSRAVSSNSRACSSDGAESGSPPSMRANSHTRSSDPSRLSMVSAAPSTVRFSTAK